MADLSGREKLERDYQEFINRVEGLAAEALRDAKEKASQILSEAEKTGESVERSINDAEVGGKSVRKKS